MKQAHIMVIDPAVNKPELGSFNLLVKRSPLPATYHLPALYGMNSIVSENVASIGGIIVLGSLASVNERLPWQSELENWLMPMLLKKKPTLGICYGHQMLAHMFGGKVDYLSTDQRHLLGLREVTFVADPLWEGKSQKGVLCVSHREVVIEVPESMAVVGSSEAVAVDGLKHKQLPIWSVQAHPEAGIDFLGVRGCSQPIAENDLLFGSRLIGGFLNLVAGAGAKERKP